MSKRRDHRIEHSKRLRGQEREDYFNQPGATPEGWLGGPHQVQEDRRKRWSREACRRPVTE